MIVEVATGRRIATAIRVLEPNRLRSLGRRWRFPWADVVKSAEVYGLVAVGRPRLILGLIAIERRRGSHVEITHLESHPDHVGRAKTLRGIPGCLLAFAARISFEIGAEGFLAMNAKTELIDHYRRSYGFEQVGSSQRMFLDTPTARRLIDAYGEEPPT